MRKALFIFFGFIVFSCLKPNLSSLSVRSRGNYSFDTKSSYTYTDYNGSRYRIISDPFRLEDEGHVYTHRAIRIDIEDMKQLFQLLADTTLYIQFYPFNYEPVKDSFIHKYNSFIPSSNTEEVECQILDRDLDTRYYLPIYVFWPKDKSIPNELNYDVLYNAFIPRQALNNETLSKGSYPSRDGRLMTYDNRLNQYVPLGNVVIYYTSKVKTILGQWFILPNIASVNSNGEFHLAYPATDQYLRIYLANNKFIICEGNSSNVKIILSDTLDNYITGSDSLEINLPTDFFLDVYKAAQYYFFQGNELLNQVEKYDTLGSAIDIHAIDNSSPDGYLGCFYNNSSPYIEVFNAYKTNYTGASSKIFGTVNHELGHATNRARVGQQVMSQTDTVIKESFASFFGWYNVYQYYSSVATTHQIVNNICTQGRQTWTASSSNINYTPIYIDLFDNYNQHTYSSSPYNQDPISGVPINTILNFALGPTSFHNVYYPLASLIGSYYTGSEYSAFISPYSLFL